MNRILVVVILLIAAVVVYIGVSRRSQVTNLVRTQLYGSEKAARLIREQANKTLRRVHSLEVGPGLLQKKVDAQAAWRDGEILFNKGEYRKAEEFYRRVLVIGDELLKHEAERASVQKLHVVVTRKRQEALRKGVSEHNHPLWQQAEEFRRLAEAAFRSAEFGQARQLLEQAHRGYDEAVFLASQPTPTPTPTPTPEVPETGIEVQAW